MNLKFLTNLFLVCFFYFVQFLPFEKNKKMLFAITETNISKTNEKLQFGKNMKEKQNLKLDINFASQGEMLAAGVSGSYVDKIMDYRDIVGGFENLKELTRISGIGEKTYKKLEKSFYIDKEFQRKKISINSSDEKSLKYFGFSKKEIKIINKKISERDYIDNNMELKEVLESEKKYVELRDLIDYQKR